MFIPFLIYNQTQPRYQVRKHTQYNRDVDAGPWCSQEIVLKREFRKLNVSDIGIQLVILKVQKTKRQGDMGNCWRCGGFRLALSFLKISASWIGGKGPGRYHRRSKSSTDDHYFRGLSSLTTPFFTGLSSWHYCTLKTAMYDFSNLHSCSFHLICSVHIVM